MVLLVVAGMENKRLAIVVVEDSLFYQQLIGIVIKHLEADVQFFTSGEQILKQLPFKQIDLAVFDYNLDGAMTGLDTLTALRLHHPGVHAIIFSTRQEVNTNENKRIYGNFTFVEKNKEGLRLLHAKVNQLTGILSC